MAKMLKMGSQLGSYLAQKLKNLDSGYLQNNALAVRITVIAGGFVISSCVVGGLFYLFGQPSNRDLLEAATHGWAERDRLMQEKIGKEDKLVKLLFANASAAHPFIEKMGSEEKKYLRAQVKDVLGEMRVGCSELLRNKDLDLVMWKLKNLKMLNKLEIVSDIVSDDS